MNNLGYGCANLIAVISGGTSGIGLATAASLAQDGAKVYILGRNAVRGQQAVVDVKAMTGKDLIYCSCDVTDIELCQNVLDAIGKREGKIDILINSAGVYQEQRLENMQTKDYLHLMDVNVKGTMFLTQKALPYMYEGGSIINLASDAAVNGNYGCPLYCASKGAVVAFSRALALDLAPKIRVNCVCPADIATPLLEKQLKEADGGYDITDMAASYPLGRIGRAEEVAHVICSLVSPANSFMTGAVICVDGGITAG